MLSGNDSMVRRNINRPAKLIQDAGKNVPALQAVSGVVNTAASDVNSA